MSNNYYSSRKNFKYRNIEIHLKSNAFLYNTSEFGRTNSTACQIVTIFYEIMFEIKICGKTFIISSIFARK